MVITHANTAVYFLPVFKLCGKFLVCAYSCNIYHPADIIAIDSAVEPVTNVLWWKLLFLEGRWFLLRRKTHKQTQNRQKLKSFISYQWVGHMHYQIILTSSTPLWESEWCKKKKETVHSIYFINKFRTTWNGFELIWKKKLSCDTFRF